MHKVTQILAQMGAGDPTAAEQLLPLVYAELRSLAAARLDREPSGQTLQPTALVHELYLRLVDQKRAQWRDREQFFGIAAKMMRRILVDRARQRSAGKRGAGALHLPIEEALDRPSGEGRAVLAIDEALARFGEIDPERARVVELRYFGGLDLDEIAAVMQVSRTTVKRHWSVARMWLHRELASEINGSGALEAD